MKKLLLIIVVLLYASNVDAQVYYTGFDNSAQQSGWVKFRKGNLAGSDWLLGAYSGAPSSPNCAFHNVPSATNAVLIEDWIVSPSFNFSGGAIIDSIKISAFTGSGIITTNDHFGIYLLNGSADPALATVTLLADLTGMAAFSTAFKDTFGFAIPPTGGNCYIALKYTALNNTFLPRFDNLKLTASTPCTAPANVYISPTINAVNITWSGQPGALLYKYLLDTTPGDPTINGASTTNTNFSTQGLLPSTTYYFHLRSICGSNIQSAWKNIVFKTPVLPSCQQPTAVYPTNITENSVTLNWSPVAGAKGYEYLVSDIADIPTGIGNTALVNHADIANLAVNTKYYAYLRTRCDGLTGYIFSPWVGREFTTHVSVSVDGLANNSSIHVFPNPVKDILTISGTQTNGRIILTNINGYVLKVQPADNNNTVLNLAEYPSGTYFISYHSGNANRNIRVFKQ